MKYSVAFATLFAVISIRPSLAQTDRYEECKATHRCNRAFQWYNYTTNAIHAASAQFENGHLNVEPVFTDFEHAAAGTLGWVATHSFNDTNITSGTPPRFSSFDFLLLDEFHVLIDEATTATVTAGPSGAILDGPATTHHVTISCTFNTTDAILSIVGEMYTGTRPPVGNSTSGTLVASSSTFEHSGEIITDPASGIEVALFNFARLDIASHLSLQTIGVRPVVLLSRSTISLHSTLHTTPGTLGGFQGATIPSDRNINGPGSRALRIHPFTLIATADTQNAIQTVSTRADAGQTLRGSFTLALPQEERAIGKATLRRALPVLRTHPIPHDASSQVVMDRIHAAMAHIVGRVRVTRTVVPTNEGGYTWTIEFITAIGSVPPLQVFNPPTGSALSTAKLVGIGAEASVTYVQQASQVGGSFRLSFQGSVTRTLSTGSSQEELAQALRDDLATVEHVYTKRFAVDPRYSRAKGSIWHIMLATKADDLVDVSPLRLESQTPAPSSPLRASTVINDATAHNQVVFVVDTYLYSHETSFPGVVEAYSVNGTISADMHVDPVSIAWGGIGGSFGGFGGGGQVDVGIDRHQYGNKELVELLGGSGGALGGDVMQVPISETLNTQYALAGQGGNGGAAVHLFAENDVVVGLTGEFAVDFFFFFFTGCVLIPTLRSLFYCVRIEYH
jgi:hypothetical protein